MTAPPKGELFGIFRKVEQNLPLSGEVASRSDDGEGLLPRSAALSQKAALHLPLPSTTPPRENGIAERPQTLRYSEIINILSAIYAQSNAERILNRPAPGDLHHKIRVFGYAILRKVPLLQRHPPGGKIRVACALPRL